ncbi:MAG TPA: RNA 3'-terminal phosphate cyclase, partial [Armatimonadota bacterium]|nr:RNA 3'-terminal phosphate cyclase [Armatimonadota bacterium]
MLYIDGSYGEGGGQILRTSLSLSALLQRPIKIENIRAGRKNPGLQPQHLTAARAIARICNGKLVGDEVGSIALEFHPGQVQPGEYIFDVSEIKASAGAVNLILQTVLLPLAF